jgi:integrase
MIAAEGNLTKGFITNRSTHTNDWQEAQRIAAVWEQNGTVDAPKAPEPSITPIYAVESFLASYGPKGKNVEQKTLAALKVLLEQRFLPFCIKYNIVQIKDFNSLDLTTKFVESWTNLVPNHNTLKASTKKGILEQFRAFLKYCLDRDWITVNNGKKIKFTAKTEKKFGMSPEEEERFFFHVKSKELRVFCLVMRYAGLRISDATALNNNQLVERASGSGWALKVFQKKTKSWVYVPIPEFVVNELRDLEFRHEEFGNKYWFLGDGQLISTTNNWYARIMRIVKQCGPFIHNITPHTFRHTFSISHLNAGINVKFVSQWLGHANTIVTEKHYAHAVRNTLLASEEAYDASLNRQQEQQANWNRQNLVMTQAG